MKKADQAKKVPFFVWSEGCRKGEDATLGFREQSRSGTVPAGRSGVVRRGFMVREIFLKGESR